MLRTRDGGGSPRLRHGPASRERRVAPMPFAVLTCERRRGGIGEGGGVASHVEVREVLGFVGRDLSKFVGLVVPFDPRVPPYPEKL